MRNFVVGLNLCPFAAAPLDEGRVRVAVHPAVEDEHTVRGVVDREIEMLLQRPASEVETTVVVLPVFAASDFVRWNALCTQLEDELNTPHGDVMVACFHPQHTWGGECPRSAAHFDRRAPYPVVNILRSASIDHVVRDGLDVGIAARNLATLEELGFDELQRRLEGAAAAASVE